jgi:hypothetical protein
MNSDFISYGDIVIPKHLEPKNKPKGYGIWARYDVEVYDGNKLIDVVGGPSRSFVRNVGRLIRNILLVTSTTNEDIIDSGGTARKPRIITGAITSGAESVIAAIGNIKFGNGTTAVNSAQFELTGTQLGSGTVTTTQITENAAGSSWKHEASVVNVTGSPFTVNEMGLYTRLRRATLASQNDQCMLLRDLVSPGVVVADTLTILGRYTITVSV